MKFSSLDQKIETALREQRPLRQVSPGFSERVIDALPSRPPSRPIAHAAWPIERPLGRRLLLAGALAALTVVGWIQFSPRSGAPAPVIASAPANPPAPVTELNLPPVSIQQVQALTAKIDEPLEKELRLVLSDTRNAIRFVAANFIPQE